MNGFAIGFGVGMRYTSPNKDIGAVIPTPPQEDIADGILLETTGVCLLESGEYFQLEQTPTTQKVKSKINKSYWNF